MVYNNFDSPDSVFGNIKNDSFLAKGAEAVVYKEIWNGILTIVKKRFPKPYRQYAFDKKIREQRTKAEANAIAKAGMYVNVPKIYEVKSDTIRMAFVEGEHAKINEEHAFALGSMLFSIHKANIVHNDFTVANVLIKGNEFYAIDFGLAFHSLRIEDKASDLYCTYASFGKYGKYVLDGYNERSNNKADEIISRLEHIRKRMRYA
ncbi:MAG: KEOPS complex kinase/ATPase Bud32 [Candidatus Anstonellales archaeon]